MSAQKYSTRQLIALEIREFLLSLPLAKHSPMGQQTDLADELSVLDSIVRKLKAFVSFLSKLNPAEYLRWMHDAFAKKVEISADETFGIDYSLEDEAIAASTPSPSVSPYEPKQEEHSKATLTPTH